jgi:agmatine deiminase
LLSTPAREGFHMPAEWERHELTWLAWPAASDLWLDHLALAQQSFVALCKAIADTASGRPPAEGLRVLVTDADAEAAARHSLDEVPVELVRLPYGDIWLRDTAPIFVRSSSGELGAVRFRFNGWGGKYVLPHDDAVADAMASLVTRRVFASDFVLEGGAIEVDGAGTCLTTRQCLLNPNRNPGFTEIAVESRLREALGVSTVLWLDEGLTNDHTDGHVDTLARFVAPGAVVCMEPAGPDDPNRRVLEAVARALTSFVDAAGRRLRVIRIPSPGRVSDAEGALLPASYVNFYIATRTVLVPTYDAASDEAAVHAIGELFPGRRTQGIPARAILTGGGALHCITQQQPLASA